MRDGTDNRCLRARAWLPALTLAGLLLAAAAPVAAQAPAGTKTFENAQFRYAVALPAGCRHEEGPGTLDAICSADLDPEKSAAASNAGALLLEVAAEIVPDDSGKTAGELTQRYDETAFRGELPEAVCGEAEKGRVKIDNVKQVLDETRVTYTAGVVCSEVKFLQIGERRASVRFLITPGTRYRLMARAPKDDFEKQKDAIEAFFASFRELPAGK
jgi:hypothetical protein